MRWSAMIWAAASLLAAAPAMAQGLPMLPGQQVTIEVDDGAHVTGIALAVRTAHDDAVLAQLSETYRQKLGEVLMPADHRGTTPPPIQPNVVTLRLLSIDGKETLLAIQNGYDEALTYRATMKVKGKSQPTSVCLVAPRGGGFEHWPHPMESIELTDFKRVAWKSGDPQPCV